MIQQTMVLQAYTPQLHLGDWQIVVFVHRRRNRITVERWHSSEKPYHPLETTGQVLRINTGIRAFRRQMPVLAFALEKLDTAGMTEEQVVEAVFQVLEGLYKVGPASEHMGFDGERLSEQDFLDFLEDRKQEALEALPRVTTH
jgi:hypothetical protein